MGPLNHEMFPDVVCIKSTAYPFSTGINFSEEMCTINIFFRKSDKIRALSSCQKFSVNVKHF